MWEFFQLITKAGMTPNECLSLFAVSMKITPHHGHNIETLLEKGLIEYNDDKVGCNLHTVKRNGIKLSDYDVNKYILDSTQHICSTLNFRKDG